MQPRDTLAAIPPLLLGAAVAIAARGFPPAPGHAIGPGAFPLVIGLALVACGLLLLLAGWRERGTSPAASAAPAANARPPRSWRNTALVLGGLVLYALALETAGFFVTAFILLAGLFAVFGVARRWIAPLAAGVTLALHVVFYSLLRVPLPWGWLEAIAW